MKEKVKQFWSDRAKTTDVPRLESQVNFQKDAETAEMYIKAEMEVIKRELPLKETDILVDLGAGNGRWSILLAPDVKNIVAVEYIEDFTKTIKSQAKEHGIKNIEILNLSGEEFIRDDFADVIFVSGLFVCLDEEQYAGTLANIEKTIKNNGILFLREPISILADVFLVDKFSEELGAHYFSVYRTAAQHIDALENRGFTLQKYAPFFEDGSILNNRVETRLYYFVFTKTE